MEEAGGGGAAGEELKENCVFNCSFGRLLQQMCVFCSCFMDQLRIVGVAVAQNLRGANSERKSRPQSQSVSVHLEATVEKPCYFLFRAVA